jgi:predicted AAA+ superfamily ATPase
MKRIDEETLKSWYQSYDRKPLILRGARQVGKSTLVRLFAENEKLDLIEFNLEKKTFFSLKTDSFELRDWLLEMESISRKKIGEKSLIFIDEIQNQPNAISKLRYFYEERPDIAVISAGSLLEITLHQQEISFPVGRISQFWLGPMTFGEFLMADRHNDLYQILINNQLKEFHHPILLEELKKFYFIGGMPKSIQTYLDTDSFIEVRKIQEELIQTYVADFPKYGKRLNLERLSHVFREVPLHLGKKIIYQHIDRDSRSLEVKKCLELLIRANLIIPVYHTSASSIPLRGQMDFDILKIYFLDIGLVNCLHEFTWDGFLKVFDESFNSKGFLAEQFVAQILSYQLHKKSPPELLYWLRDKNISKAEVDFVISSKNKIIPLEIKSQKGGSLKSLKIFAQEKNCDLAYKLSKEWFGEENLTIDPMSNLSSPSTAISGQKKILKVENWPLYSLEGLIKKIV